MSPTLLRYKNARIYFFSREESRMHVHISSHEGEAKFWLEPMVELANSVGFNRKQINEFERIVVEKQNEFIKSWKNFFGN